MITSGVQHHNRVHHRRRDVLQLRFSLSLSLFRYLAVSYLTLVVVRRDLQVFVLAVGHLFDLVVNKALKTWFAEARPPGDQNVGRADD